MATAIPSHAVRELALKLQAVQGRARAAIKREYAQTYGCSQSTLSRALCEIGARERHRSDAGRRRKAVTDEQLLVVAALQQASLSLRKGVVMPAKDALDIAAHNGLVQEPVEESYYNAWLRDREGSRREQSRLQIKDGQITDYVHTELRSLGPNHVHQVDFSLAVNWKIFQGKLQYEHLIYKNKLPEAGVPRLYRLLVVDHATGCFFPFYSQSTGETVQATLEGLYRAWTEKKLRGESIKHLYPFRGVPQILMADRGSANRAAITIALLQRLGVKLNICVGARSKGTVEVAHNFWEQHFESRMRLQPPESVEQLNEWAVDFAARYCAQELHSRFGSQRSTMWAWHIGRRPETQLRELRCDFETFRSIAVSEPHKALVNGARVIKFRGQKYRVPECFLPGEHVAVQYSPFTFPEIQVRAWDVPTAEAWVCEPVELDEFGFATDAALIGSEYKAKKRTPTTRFVSDATKAAEGLIDGGKIRAFGYHAEKVQPIEVKPGASEVAIEPAAPALLGLVQARAAVVEFLGRPFTPAEATYVNEFFRGREATEADVAAVVAELQRGITPRVMQFPGAGIGASK